MSSNIAPEQTGSAVQIPVELAPVYEGSLAIPLWVWNLLEVLSYVSVALFSVALAIIARDLLKGRR